MSEKSKKERVTMSIDSALMKELREQCLKDKRPYSSAIEIGIEHYLEKSKKEKK